MLAPKDSMKKKLSIPSVSDADLKKMHSGFNPSKGRVEDAWAVDVSQGLVDEATLAALPSAARAYQEQQNEHIRWLLQTQESYGMPRDTDSGGPSETESKVEVLTDTSHSSTRSTSADADAGARAPPGCCTTSVIVQLSLLANIFLFGAKLVAALSSGSMAVVASLVDSGLDLLSGAILYYTEQSMKRWAGTLDFYKYPQGKTRQEPVGIMVFAVIMGASFMGVLRDAAVEVGAGAPAAALELGPLTIGILIATVVLKAGLFLTCLFGVSPEVRARVSGAVCVCVCVCVSAACRLY